MLTARETKSGKAGILTTGTASQSRLRLICGSRLPMLKGWSAARPSVTASWHGCILFPSLEN